MEKMNEVLDGLPDDLRREIQQRLAAGEFSNVAEVVIEALRYYFDRNREQDWAEYVAKELAWSRRRAGT